MRVRRTSEYVPVLKWDAPGPYPTVDPPSENFLLREWSQDLIDSTNNRWFSDRRTNNKGGIGGNFWVYRRFYNESSTLGEGPIGFSTGAELPPAPVGRPFYISPQYAAFDEIRNSSFPLPLPSSSTHLNALASQAIGQMAPNKPEANLATFIGELREGLPHGLGIAKTAKERTLKARNAGDEYLNVEFGWKPLVRDIQSFAKAVQNSDRILSQFEQGAGKLLRREHHFQTELDVEGPVTINSNCLPVPSVEPRHYVFGGNAGTLTRSTTSRTERWVVATFAYGLPPLGTPQRRAAEANKLLGTNLSPDLLWNLAPWSWALDWAANAGTIAENLSLFNSDCLAMPWCYIMEHKTIRSEYTWRSNGSNVYRTYPGRHTLRQVFTTEMKLRRTGSPYGFEVDWPDFSANQLAILASLGIARNG